MNRLLHGWSFAQLQSFIEYKAAWLGIPVVFVKADYTSQCCSKCGYIKKSNRNGRKFKCKKCGQPLAIDGAQVGKEAKCPGCGTGFTVPTVEEAKAQAAAPSAEEARAQAAPPSAGGAPAPPPP